MRLPQRIDHGRAAFTLIELLIVIAIIALLVSLTTAGVFRIWQKVDDVRTTDDISQLSIALGNFKAKFKTYPPDVLFLSNIRAQYDTPAGDPLRTQSLKVLSQIWPRLDWNSGIDWTGGNAAAMGQGVILEGDQCLVFFLGGIQSGGAYTGFSANPKNPTDSNTNRIGPFFDGFNAKKGRLFKRVPSPPGSLFLSYADGYGTPPPGPAPYLYFSSTSAANRANGYRTTSWPQNGGTTLGTVSPYYLSTTTTLKQYLNPSSFQILSAGRNGVFGAGGPIDPTVGTSDVNGADDLSNFSSSRLGIAIGN